MNIISMDFGTSSLKLSVINEDLDIIETVKENYDFYIPEKGWVEIKPEDLIQALINGIKKLKVNLKTIEGLCYDTFSPSVVFMDFEGNPLYPVITHLDRRSSDESNIICNNFGLDFYHKITGTLPFPGGTSLTTILWFKNNLNEIYKQSFKIGHLTTFLHKYLTGLWVIDTVNASMSGLYNTITKSSWSEDILSFADISKDLFPEVKEPGEHLGFLNNHELISMGIKKGIPVCTGTNDIASAQIGAKNNSAGDILQVSGSSDMISILTNNPVINKSYYLRCSANKNLWQIFAITSSGFALEWIRKELFRDIDIETFYSEEIKKALDTGSNDVIFHPYISGDRQSLEIKKGIFEGIELNTCRENILAAMIEGFHLPITTTLKTAENFIKLSREIKTTGGLTKNQNIIAYKQKIFKDYKLHVFNECPLIGNVKLWITNNTKSLTI